MLRRTNYFTFSGMILTAAMLGACGTSNPTDSGTQTGNDAAALTDTGSNPTDEGGNQPETSVGPDASIPNPDGARVFTFVVSALQIEPHGANDAGVPAGQAYGFNLDNTFTLGTDLMASATAGYAGCGQPDFLSPLDNDQNTTARNGAGMGNGTGTPCAASATGCIGGVDNQLPGLVGEMGLAASFLPAGGAQVAIDEQINANKLALIVQVSGVGNDASALMNDPSVQVAIFLGYPTFSTGCDSVQAGRVYAVSSDFLVGGTDPVANAKLKFPGSIVNGRVDAAITGDGVLPLALNIMNLPLTLNLHTPHLRFDISADGSSGSRGNLGAYVPIADLITAISQIPAASGVAGLIPTIVGPLADFEINGICNNEMNASTPVFGGLGVGLGLNMVSATFAAAPATSAPPGSCGASSTGTDAGTTTTDSSTATDAGAGGQ